MKTIKKIRSIIGQIIAIFIFSKSKRRHIRKFFENYDIKQANIYKGFKHQIISLGNNCMGRTITTKYGIKPTRIYGEKTIVFDQIFSPNIKNLVHLWNNNFDDFFDDVTFDKERNSWAILKYNCYAPHEFQLTKEEFIKITKQRIKNFYNILKTDKYAIFIRFETEDCSPEVVNLLNEKIKEQRGSKPYKLFIINHCDEKQFSANENIVIINQQQTLSEKWQLELDTDVGIKFCKSFMDPINQLIDDINNIQN